MKIQRLQLNKIEYYKNKYNISSLCAKVLDAMQLHDDMIDDVLINNRTLYDIDDTLLEPIIHRIKKAKDNNEKVLICGDYDCDGICATTILYDALLKYGLDVGYYIPNRFTQGYGLHIDTVHMAHNKGYSLLITVDNGVKACAALAQAKEYKMDIILTDHHAYEDNELICDYFLHPNILPDYYEKMCGAAMAFLIAKALIGLYENHIILCGIATIGDVMPMLKFNRVIVKECIRLLRLGKYPFIQQLSNDHNEWDEKKIAFQIVPKLNSVGRLADRANVNNMIKFLLCEDINQIPILVDQLNKLNDMRKNLSLSMEKTAKSKMVGDTNFIILYDENFYEGLNGIVASHLANKMQKSVMVLSENNSILKGSIRSYGIDLTSFFDGIKHELISYGGHKDAAGIAFEKNKLNIIENYVNQKISDKIEEIELKVIEVDKDEITIENLQSLSILKPFGQEFELPLFLIKDENIKVSKLGNGSHLKYQGNEFTYLYFNHGERYTQDIYKDSLTFIGTFEINVFRNKKSINMIVEYIDE